MKTKKPPANPAAKSAAAKPKKKTAPLSIDSVLANTAAVPVQNDEPGIQQIEIVPIDSVLPDPANARKHGKRDLEVAIASLKRFRQQKPIVVDQNGIVRAGNGTLAAAKALGWTKIAIVRSNLTGSEITAYAIVDNRSAELSKWDDEALKGQMMGLAGEGMDLGQLGFDGDDLDDLIGDAGTLEDPAGAGAGSGPITDDTKFMVLITCSDEAHQAKLLEDFTSEGLECKALNQ